MWLALAVPGIVWAVWRAANDPERLAMPSSGVIALCMIAMLALTLASLASWTVLFDADVPRERLVTSFTVSQLTKYSPVGGVTQLLSQLDLARDAATTQHIAGQIGVSKATMLAGGCVWCPVAALTMGHLQWLPRLVVAAGTIGIALAHPFVVKRALRLGSRLVPALGTDLHVPPPWRLAASTAWAAAALASYGIGQVVLANALGADLSLLSGTAGFVLAWAAGFAAVPVPAGLGVREVAATVLLDGPVAPVLAASVVFRLVQLATEALVALVAALVLRHRTNKAATPTGGAVR